MGLRSSYGLLPPTTIFVWVVEMLIKMSNWLERIFVPWDAYLLAGVHGAPTIILRATQRKTGKGASDVLPLSDQALRDAGNFSCTDAE